MEENIVNYRRIEEAISYITANFTEQPSLRDIAASVHLSEFHFQRMFLRWAGISPKKFMQFLTIGYAKKALRESQPLLDVAYDAGFSSASRLYDLFVSFEGVTPGEYREFGRNIKIRYGFYKSPFGECLIAVTGKGVCWLSFVEDRQRNAEIGRMKEHWSESELVREDKAVAKTGERIFNRTAREKKSTLGCFVKGTRFQIKVWEALLRVPFGTLTTYQGIASRCGDANASRAAASAIGSNPIAFLIPCHRVIRKSGNFSDYRWGINRKTAMIGWEAARTNN
jgi:AraC family transcriptional regulator, regulatory protein of adaptative response / methylated-DNA-[protein]-cysteine methyltransferase